MVVSLFSFKIYLYFMEILSQHKFLIISKYKGYNKTYKKWKLYIEIDIKQMIVN